MTLLGKVISKDQNMNSFTVELPLEGKICYINHFRKDSKVKQICKVGDYLVLDVDVLPTGDLEVVYMSFCKI